MDNILKGFQDYIDSQNYFDIVYSKKVGYVWMVVTPFNALIPERLCAPEDLLRELFDSIINDVLVSREKNDLDTAISPLTEQEKMESRRRITAILKTFQNGGDEYMECMDNYIKNY